MALPGGVSLRTPLKYTERNIAELTVIFILSRKVAGLILDEVI
jgi:hypothetical protein